MFLVQVVSIYEAVIFTPASSGFHILPSVEAQITGTTGTGTAVLDELRGGRGLLGRKIINIDHG